VRRADGTRNLHDTDPFDGRQTVSFAREVGPKIFTVLLDEDFARSPGVILILDVIRLADATAADTTNGSDRCRIRDGFQKMVR